MKRFIRVNFNADSQEQFDNIVDGLQTTIDRDPIVVGTLLYIEVLNDKELLEEAFALGVCWRDIETKFGYDTPFVPIVVELEENPK